MTASAARHPPVPDNLLFVVFLQPGRRTVIIRGHHVLRCSWVSKSHTRFEIVVISQIEERRHDIISAGVFSLLLSSRWRTRSTYFASRSAWIDAVYQKIKAPLNSTCMDTLSSEFGHRISHTQLSCPVTSHAGTGECQTSGM
jgi:hypothetical protein